MKCLVKDCEKEASCRGLCWNHYMTARRVAGANKDKWDKIIAAGLALPPSRPGRKSNNPFTDNNLPQEVSDAVLNPGL